MHESKGRVKLRGRNLCELTSVAFPFPPSHSHSPSHDLKVSASHTAHVRRSLSPILSRDCRLLVRKSVVVPLIQFDSLSIQVCVCIPPSTRCHYSLRETYFVLTHSPRTNSMMSTPAFFSSHSNQNNSNDDYQEFDLPPRMSSYVVKRGYVSVKEDGLRLWSWSKRWLLLREQTLTFHRNEVRRFCAVWRGSARGNDGFGGC